MITFLYQVFFISSKPKCEKKKKEWFALKKCLAIPNKIIPLILKLLICIKCKHRNVNFFPILCSPYPYTRSQKQLNKKSQKNNNKNSLSFLMYGQIQMWQLKPAVWNNRQSEISIEWLNDNVSRVINCYTHRFFLFPFYTRYYTHFQCCTGLLGVGYS